MKRGASLPLLVGVVGLSLMVQEPLSGQIGLQEVTSLRFQGNRQFPDETLANAINTRETECRSFLFKLIPFCLAGADFSLDPYFLNEREFRRDHVRVRLFYYQRGFRETGVDTVMARPSEDEVQITFLIQEGEPIRVVTVDFQLLEDLPDSTVLDNLPLRVGEPLSLVALDATRETLENRLRNRGFAHGEV
ncbi:MAG: POTRA domain-containing protein, partial [Gemmatimonadota bacterium]